MIKDYEARKIDHISHYILRFAYCQSEEHRRWFIAREFELFKIRWLNLNIEQKQNFITNSQLNYKCVSVFVLFEFERQPIINIYCIYS